MSWIATAIIGGAVIGGGAAIIGSKSASRASVQATEIQAEAQGEATAETREQFDIVRADLQKALDQGLIDLDTANKVAEGFLTGGFEQARNILAETITGQPGGGLVDDRLPPGAGLEELNLARGFLRDPSRALELPGVQFQFEQGERALENILSKSTGGAVSGDIIKAAQEFGQNFASTKLDEAINRLVPFIDVGLETRTNLATLGLEEGETLANLASTLGINLANLRSSAASGQAATAQAFTPLLASGLSRVGDIEAGGRIRESNININLANQLSRTGSTAIEQLIETGVGRGRAPGRERTFSSLTTPQVPLNQFFNPQTGIDPNLLSQGPFRR